jgi:L-fucose isomerase-like protein
MPLPRIGFVTCVHPFYDLPAVTAHRDLAIAGLREAGCEVVVAQTPRSPLDAVTTAGLLKQSDVDLALLFFCTWVAEDITLEFARELAGTPLLLWALPYLDRDVPMPSPISGITASGSNILRLGKPFSHLVGVATPGRLDQVARTAKVAATVRKLSRARFGIVGRPCPGMLDVSADEADLQSRLGVTTIHLELGDLLDAARQASTEEASRLARGLMADAGSVEGVGTRELTESFCLYLAMKQLLERHELDAYCVRCWPELRDQHRMTACLMHSQLSEAGIPSTCEVDLPALITAYVLSQLAGAPACSFDVTGYLQAEDAIQLAHCGSAALSLAGSPARAALRSHMRTRTGATVEFGLKPGVVTLAKLTRPLDRGWRLFVARGEALETEPQIRGSVATVRPDPSAGAFLDQMLTEGIEHHIVLVYGDWRHELAQFCRFTGMELLEAGV